MNIALIAADAKKELMVQFCIAYCGILARHHICATSTTGRLISDASGLEVERLLPGPSGGEQQIAARVAYNEIDLVLIFRDPSENYDGGSEVNELLRNCDLNSIPAATNVAAAEVLIHGLARGDLDWRSIVNPHE